MWIAVIQWVSIALSWIAIGINVWGIRRTNRLNKTLAAMIENG